MHVPDRRRARSRTCVRQYELNPCEGVWDWSKLNDMGNVTPQSFEELITRTRSSLTKLRHRDHIHRWCSHQAEIEIIES
jgi:hypothetical protein